MRFSEAWSALTSRFLKLECRQSYREIETNESQAAYESGDVDEARELLRFVRPPCRLNNTLGE